VIRILPQATSPVDGTIDHITRRIESPYQIVNAM